MIEGLAVIAVMAGLIMAFAVLPAIIVAIGRVAWALGTWLATVTLWIMGFTLLWWIIAAVLGAIAGTVAVIAAIGILIHVKVNRIRLF